MSKQSFIKLGGNYYNVNNITFNNRKCEDDSSCNYEFQFNGKELKLNESECQKFKKAFKQFSNVIDLDKTKESKKSKKSADEKLIY
jgi:hypothetical protein